MKLSTECLQIFLHDYQTRENQNPEEVVITCVEDEVDGELE